MMTMYTRTMMMMTMIMTTMTMMTMNTRTMMMMTMMTVAEVGRRLAAREGFHIQARAGGERH